MATRQYAKTAQRRAEIVSAALEVFSEQGYNEASLRTIAERVQLSEAGLLHHFSSKFELLTAVLKRRDEVDISNYDRGTGEVETMRAFFQHNLSVPNLIRLYTKLFVDAIEPSHPAHGYFLARNRAVLHRFETRLAQDQSRGLVRAHLDPKLLALELHTFFEGLQMLWLMRPDTDVLTIFDDLTSRWIPDVEDRSQPAAIGPVAAASGVSSIEVRFAARNLEPNSPNRAHAPDPSRAGAGGGMVVGADMHWHLEDALSRMELSQVGMDAELKFVRPIMDGDPLAVRVALGETAVLSVQIGSPGALDSPRIVGLLSPLPDMTPRWAREFRHVELPPKPVEFTEDFALAGADLGSVSFKPSLEEANAHRAALGIMPSNSPELPTAYLVQFSRRAFLAPNVSGPSFSVHTSTTFRQYARVTQGASGLEVRGRYDRVFGRRGHRYVVLRTALFDATERVLLEAEYTSIYQLRTES